MAKNRRVAKNANISGTGGRNRAIASSLERAGNSAQDEILIVRIGPVESAPKADQKMGGVQPSGKVSTRSQEKKSRDLRVLPRVKRSSRELWEPLRAQGS